MAFVWKKEFVGVNQASDVCLFIIFPGLSRLLQLRKSILDIQEGTFVFKTEIVKMKVGIKCPGSGKRVPGQFQRL